MIQLIALIIFIISFGSIIFMIVGKLPVLAELPKNGTAGIRDHKYILHFEEKIKKILVSFEKQIILHKLLSWSKVFVLKIETQIDHLLHSIRRKAKEDREKQKEIEK